MTVLHALAEKPISTNNTPTSVNMLSIAETVIQRDSVDLNAIDNQKRTALHIAIRAGNVSMVDLLLKSGRVNINALDKDLNSPLSIALDCDDFELADRLVNRNSADPNARRTENGDTLIHVEVERKRVANVQFLLERKCDVNVQNKLGETALHRCCSMLEVSLEIVSLLLKHGADPGVQVTSSGSTALHIAIEHGNSPVLSEILAHSSLPLPLEVADRSGETALSCSVWSNELALAKLLVDKGGDVNVKGTDGQPLLLRVIEAQLDEGALFLINNGADLAVSTVGGLTSLQLAVKSGLVATTRALCRNGADLNVRDKKTQLTPLWTALERGDMNVASSLVEFGCDTDCWAPGPDNCEQTLLHKAIDESNETAACFLIRGMCDINAVRRPLSGAGNNSDIMDKQTPLHMACAWGLQEIVSALMEMNANVNAQDSDGRSPVHIAIVEHREEILKLLLHSSNVCLTLRDKFGLSPFSAAMQAKNSKAAQAILQREPRVASQVDSKGYNLLHRAIKQCDFEAVLFLLGVHTDVNMPTHDSSRLTPLHLSAQAGDEMIMRNLILAGGNVNAVSARGYSPLSVSAYHDKPLMCSILLENGADPNAVDKEGNNALHCAVAKASFQCVRKLLTESNVKADAVNTRQQTPLLLLGQCGKENAAAIFDLFMETIPDYPADKKDDKGNTMLLLAYMNGNANLCKAGVRAGCCIGVANGDRVSVFNYQTPTKQLLFRLLDQLEAEPRWAEGDFCSECLAKFNITTRKHHCRHCGRLLCAKCSERTMPILKYDLQKPVRVCDVCCDVLTLGAQR